MVSSMPWRWVAGGRYAPALGIPSYSLLMATKNKITITAPIILSRANMPAAKYLTLPGISGVLGVSIKIFVPERKTVMLKLRASSSIRNSFFMLERIELLLSCWPSAEIFSSANVSGVFIPIALQKKVKPIIDNSRSC